MRCPSFHLIWLVLDLSPVPHCQDRDLGDLERLGTRPQDRGFGFTGPESNVSEWLFRCLEFRGSKDIC